MYLVEHARTRERVPTGQPPGIAFTIDSVLQRPIDVFIPDRAKASTADERTSLMHLCSWRECGDKSGRYFVKTEIIPGSTMVRELPLIVAIVGCAPALLRSDTDVPSSR